MEVLDQVLDYDLLRQQIPYFIYQRIQLPRWGTSILDSKFFFTLPIGYCYLLRTMRYVTGSNDIHNTHLASDILVEFTSQVRGRKFQNTPFPPRLISTPGAVETSVPGTSDWFAGCLKNNLILNFIYYRQDTIDIRFRFPNYLLLDDDMYIRVCLEGYMIPDKILDQWS